MIWGKTNEEKRKKYKQKDENWFVWYPVKTVLGRWVWLERVKREFWSSWGSCGYHYYLKK